MTNSELDKLKELAERATPGPWKSFYHNRTESWALTYPREGCDGVNHLENVLLSAPDGRSIYSDTTDYIAAVSPDVVLKLIAEVKELRRELHKTRSLTVEESLRAENTNLKVIIETINRDYAEIQDQLAETHLQLVGAMEIISSVSILMGASACDL